jgi:sugar lactone lactonase YvrE
MAATAHSRFPHYVSTATQSMIITLSAVNGTAYAGTPSSIASNLTTSNPACTGTPLTCTITAPAAAGADVFTVVTYDAQQASSSPATPAGHALSQAAVTVTVAANQANVAPPLVLNGVAASITLSAPSGDPHVLGTQTTGYQIIGNQPYSFAVTARDADGGLIIDPGAPSFSVQVGSDALVVAPIGGPVNAYSVRARRFSATPVIVSIAASNSSAFTNVTFTTIQELWVVNSFNSTVTGYAMGSPPSQINADTMTSGNGILGPISLAFDSSGNLWVANFNGINAYSGTTPIPAKTIPGINPSAIAFDSNGILWVASFGSPSPTGGITAYSGTTQLLADTITNPQGSLSGLWGPRYLAFDAAGNLWVANGGGNVRTVTTYSGTTQLAASTITGVVSPWGLAFDGSGALWVVDSSSAAPSINPYSGPTLIYGNTITAALNQPAGIAFDASGSLWVSNNNSGGSITEYSGTSQIAGNTITAGLSQPVGLAFAPSATLPFNPPPPHPSPPPPPVVANPSSVAFSAVGTGFVQVVVSQAGYNGDYSLTNSNPSVASAVQSGVIIIVRPLAFGTTVLRVTGGFGQFVDIPVAISTSGNVVVAPSSLAFTNIGTAYNQTVALSQAGYSGAFSLFIFDSTVVSASISGNTLTVTPLASGSTVVRVGGANSQFADVSVGVTISNVNIHAARRRAP